MVQKNQLLYVANWKMQLSYLQAVAFAENNKANFLTLAKHAKIVFCPSFDALLPIIELFKNSSVAIGAQNCSSYPTGAYTGEVSAQSIKELGCTYCIVGHSERRMYFHETDTIVEQKLHVLQQHNIIPIVCIGETKEQYEKKEAHTVLGTQLQVLSKSEKHIVIAYEPVWAIGTGIPASLSYIQEIFDWIIQECEKNISSEYTILYGGSVNGDNAKEIKTISGLGGFLIGNASLDFQKFQNIVLS